MLPSCIEPISKDSVLPSLGQPNFSEEGKSSVSPLPEVTHVSVKFAYFPSSFAVGDESFCQKEVKFV